MSFNDGELHAAAGVGASLLTGGLAVMMAVYGHACSDECQTNAECESGETCKDGSCVKVEPLDDMEAIEASIAYKKAPAKQPQKKTRQPDPIVKPDGVSHDETKIPEVKKPEDKPKNNDKDPLAKVPDRKEKDDPVGKPTTDVGDFNDNARGFAETTSGDPFFQGLAADFRENWEFPKILSAKGSAAGCLHITADGKIAKTKLDPKSGDEALDDSIERALKKIEKLRNDKPEPVPTHLLKQATTRWICFKSNPQEQQRE
jgi:hypothetical protein